MVANWKRQVKLRQQQKTNWQGVPKFAIRKFMSRPRKNFRVYKRMSPQELLIQRNRLPIRPPIWNILDHHQKVCLVVGAKMKRFAFLCGTGMGKTLLSLALIRYFQKTGELKQILVLVPNRSNKTEWAKQIIKHSPSTTINVLDGSSVKKWESLETSDAHITVDTFSGFVRMVSKAKAHRKKKGKQQLVPNPSLMNKMRKRFQGLICDESTSAKNKKSLPYRICKNISKDMGIVFVLTGTPFNRDPIDIWSQMYLVDKGETLGETMGLFRAAFYEKKEEFFGMKYIFDKSKKKLLHRFLANRSIRYIAKKSELPRLIPDVRKAKLPKTAEAYYDEAVAAIKRTKGNYIENRNAFLRMRQISSGFIGFKDDLEGTTAKVELPDNPKLDLLLAAIKHYGNRKMIVFHDFIYSGEKICAALKKLKITHALVNGKTKDVKEELSRFENDGAQILVLNNRAGGFGLNLQHASVGIYYEAPVSAIDRVQTRDRFYRRYSPHRFVYCVDLVIEDTVDEKIIFNYKTAGNLLRSIIDGKINIERRKRRNDSRRDHRISNTHLPTVSRVESKRRSRL